MIQPGHVVAIFGGAIAGSEAAFKLTERGIRCVVFEQNAIPYGKIESGLPKWHTNLRDKQESIIDKKLSHPLVEFIPLVKLGENIEFEDLIKNWGFSAVLLATGAWRDRPLPLTGMDKYVNKGLYYQNPFVAWFNNNHDPDYYNPVYQIPDNAIIIGGGLASIDVAKILMIETTRKALKKKGIDVDAAKIERKGIPNLLSDLGLSFDDLNLTGCTLYYRRRLIDMPLNRLPDNPTGEDFEIAYRIRNKIMDNVMKKFLFRFEDCHQPVDKIVENDQLKGLVFQKTIVKDGKLVIIEGSEYEVRTPQIVSAIGSLPESIPGLPHTGDTFEVADVDTGQIRGFDILFALGNAVTGRGNIKESKLHGRRVSEKVMDEFLTWQVEDYEEIFDRAVENADNKAEMIGNQLQQQAVLSPGKIQKILDRVQELQKKSGYNCDYESWIKKHLPRRVESQSRNHF